MSEPSIDKARKNAVIEDRLRADGVEPDPRWTPMSPQAANSYKNYLIGRIHAQKAQTFTLRKINESLGSERVSQTMEDDNAPPECDGCGQPSTHSVRTLGDARLCDRCGKVREAWDALPLSDRLSWMTVGVWGRTS